MSYQVIFAALKPDVTDAVVDAAKECGISGATIFSGRGTGLHEAKTFLGLTLESQTDIVFFLTEAELVEPVIAAIEKAGRLDEHGTGVVFTLPVDRVAGTWKEYVRRKVVRELPHSLPDLEDGVAIYGYGPEVDSLLRDLENREITVVVIEEDESVAHRLYARGRTTVQATVTDEVPDLAPMLKARALVLNGEDEDDRPVEVILLSRNDPDTGLRAFRPMSAHGLDISRGAFLSGRPPWRYLEAFNASSLEKIGSVIPERTRPGATVFTRIPRAA